jgi:hypothetical protein
LIRNKMTCHFKTLKPHLSCCFLCCFFLLLQYQILLLIFSIASHIWLLQRMKFWRWTVWFICLACLKYSQVQVDLHFGSDGSIHVSISSFDFPPHISLQFLGQYFLRILFCMFLEIITPSHRKKSGSFYLIWFL